MADFVNEETLRRWEKRTANTPAHVQEMVRRIGASMLVISRRHLNEQIYSIPEDVSPRTGKKKWERTGNLFKNEKLIFAPDGSGVTLINTMVYAEARHELGRDGRKTKRPAHWRENILTELRAAFEAEIEFMSRQILEGR